MKTGEVYTLTIWSFKPFSTDPMPHIGLRFKVGSKTLRVTAVRISDLVLDAVVD